MKIEVNITKNRFFVLIASIFFITAGIFTYAYNADWQANPGNTSAVMGHTVDEVEGLDDYVRQIVNEEVSGIDPNDINCTFGTVFSYSSSSDVGRYVVDLPSICRTGARCAIKEEVYRQYLSAPSLVLVKLSDFYQDPATGKWNSVYDPSGGNVNGDASSTDILSIYTVSSPKFDSGKTIRLLDDTPASGAVQEHSSTKIVVEDTSTTAGIKLSFCTYG